MLKQNVSILPQSKGFLYYYNYLLIIKYLLMKINFLYLDEQ